MPAILMDPLIIAISVTLLCLLVVMWALIGTYQK
jgi:hypothetical protein